MAISLWAVFLFILGLSSALYKSPKASPTIRAVAIVFYVALLAFALLRMARARLCVLPDGVRVHNFLRNRFVPWEEISGFSLRPWGPWDIYFTPIGHVDLKDGSSVLILGISRSAPAMWPKRTPADDMIDELNRILEARQGNV